MTIRKVKVAAALWRLAEQFPRTFVAAKHLPHRPLKVGIAADVQERCSDIDRRDLVAALAAYTHRIAYLQAIVAGADRIDLAGNPAGEVTAADAEHAVVVLARIMAAREAQRHPVPVIAPAAAPPVAPPADDVSAAARGLKHKPVLHLRLGQRR
jgi:ProP effector